MTVTFCGHQSGHANISFGEPPVVVVTCALDFAAHGITADAVNATISWWSSKFHGGLSRVEVFINDVYVAGDYLEIEWKIREYNYVAHDGDVITWVASVGIGHAAHCIVDFAYVQTSGLSLDEEECNGYCIIFEWIGNRFYDIEEWWTDFGLSSQNWWIIGDEVKTLCDLVAVPFREVKEFFWQLDEWCEKICRFACRGLTWDSVLANIRASFGMLSYSASEFVMWLYIPLDEAFHLAETWRWISDVDEWFDTKLSNFKDGLEDWIVEKFETILDKVFKP